MHGLGGHAWGLAISNFKMAGSQLDEIKKLEELFQGGFILEDEFSSRKESLLGTFL